VIAYAARGRRALRLVLLAVIAVVSGSAGPRALAAQPSPTAIVGRINSTGDRPIDFHAATFPDTVYVGQQVTYQVAVLLSEEARGRLRRNPEFLPPELRGLLAYELGTPSRVPPRGYGGRYTYEAHVFQRALFGVTAGAIRVPAPLLTYSLPQSASYFSREERYVVRAESALLVVKPLPTEGRPAEFTGAVGVLRASVRFDSSAVRVGDPFVLTVRIEGTGNVRLLPRPLLELSWATLVPGTERVQMDTSGALVRGVKEFEFLLTPTRDGPVTLPVVRYPYFDPYREEYRVAETVPADVRVAAGDLAAPGPAEESDQLPLRSWYQRNARSVADAPRYLPLALFCLLLLAPIPALVTLVQRARGRRRAVTIASMPLAPREVVPDDNSPPGIARRTRRTLLAQLAARLHVPPGELVTRADLERVLRRRGVTRATTRDLLALLDALAVLGFGGAAANGTADVVSTASVNGEAQATQLLDRVNAEAVPHGRTRLWARRGRRSGTLMVILLPLTFTITSARPARAQPPSDDPGATVTASAATLECRSARKSAEAGGTVAATPLDLLVGEASAAYNARRFASAAQRFATAAAACPRDVALLVNWGSAAWGAGDTVSAVIAWQRAARLDPLAADVQERLALLPAGARGGLADVPMVPVTLLAVIGVVAWFTAWLLFFLSWRRAEGNGWLTAAGAALLVLAFAAGGTAWWGHRALDASGLAVVRRPETLRAAPGFEAATAGGVSTGDVVRMLTVQEGWFRVMLTDDRQGWVPASRLAPLVGPTATR
jgi:hypothetical protein